MERTLGPHEDITFDLPVHADSFNEIRVLQIEGMTQTFLVDEDGHESLPHFNDGGIGSVERIPLIAAQTGTIHLRVESRERHAQVVFQVIRSLERTPQPADEKIVQAEAAFTEAEYYRHRTGFHPAPAKRSPAYILGLYDRADGLASQANDEDLVRESLIGKARYQIYSIAAYQQGVQTATQATELPASTSDQDQQALGWKTLASALALVDRYDESITASEHAITLYKNTGDLYWQGIVLGNLAYTYQEIGESSNALQAAQQSLRIARQIADDYGVGFSLATIGEIYQGRGEYQQAIDAYDAALDSANAVQYPQVMGEVWTDLGQLYAQLSDWERARNAYAQALPILQKDGDGVNEIEVFGHLGELALHAHQPLRAQQYFNHGLARAQAQQLIREETFLKTGLAQSCLQIHCSKDPLISLSEARVQAENIHQIDGEATIDAAIGDRLAALHHDAAAMRAYAQSAELWKTMSNASDLAAVEAAMARVEVDRGQLQSAWASMKKALADIESSRADIDSDRLRTSYFASRHSYYDLGVDILMRLDQVYPHRGYAVQAWNVAERARARTLRDQLRSVDSSDDTPSNRQLQQQQAALELKLHDAESELPRLGSTPSDIVKAQTLQQSIHDMLLQADQLEAKSRASNPTYQTLLAKSAMAPASLVRAVLDQQTALVEYWVGTRRSYLWIVTAEGVHSFRLPNQNVLEALVHSYQQYVIARDNYLVGEDISARQLRIRQSDTNLEGQSRRLAKVLLPISLPPQMHRLLIVADGSLLSMPFAALELPRRHPVAPSYLIQRYDLVYEPSAFTAMTLMNHHTAQANNWRIAIFADPVYSRTDVRVERTATRPAVRSSQAILRTASIENLSDLSRLPDSRREAMAVAQIAGQSNTSLFLDFDASPRKVEAIDWKTYAVAHFAAHAIVDTEHPEFSGIVLSMFHRDGTPANGVLWLHDVYRLEMPVSLVALSGCETADGKSIPGEGINGLTRAFLYAGARSVVGTLWDAEDNSSEILMREFYEAYIHSHVSAASALRQAQLKVLSDGSHKAPYYWAAFVLEGDWHAR